MFGNIEFGPHFSLRVRGKLAPNLVLGQFFERGPQKLKKACVYSKKLIVATHFRNSVGNIAINSNRLQQIAESCNKLVFIHLNEVKETTQNEHNNFITFRSSLLPLFP